MTTEEKITSIRSQEQIGIRGFACIDSNLHMLEWLGRGRDVRQFVVNDVETELYLQDQGAQVLSIECTSDPKYETNVKREGMSQKGIVSQFAVTFPLRVRVRASTGATWVLAVHHNYNATDLDVPGHRKLTLNFQIVGQPEIEAGT